MYTLKLSGFMVIVIVAQVLTYPVEEATSIPVLRPSDNDLPSAEPAVEPVTEPGTYSPDHTDFPILTPNPDDYMIDRPEPVNNENEVESNPEAKPVDRPTPEDVDESEGFFPNIPGLFPKETFALENMGMRVKRAADDDKDDTVVVEAASCDVLKKQCEDDNDLISCETYNENCTDGTADDKEISDLLDCINSGKVECPRLSSQ